MKHWYNEKTPNRPHAIFFNRDKSEGMNSLLKHGELKEEVEKWLNDNIGYGNWDISPIISMASFASEDDVMAFILRWS